MIALAAPTAESRRLAPVFSLPARLARLAGLTRRDTVPDLLLAFGSFLAYGVLDWLTRGAAVLDTGRASGPSLLLAAISANPQYWLVLVLLVVAVTWRYSHRFLVPWSALDRGLALRWLVGPLIVLVAWQGSLYHYNFLLDRSHLLDRLLVVALALGALVRPALLLPFALQSRVVAAQFVLPSGILAAQNIDELLIIVVLAIAGTHLVTVVTGRNDTAAVMLVVIAAIATHFFVPGRGKLALGWLVEEDLANLASSGRNLGWLGQTDGSLSRFLAGAAGALGWPARAATLVLELLVALAAATYRMFRWWMPVAIMFHVVNFLFLGYWFLSWVVLEFILLVMLTRPGLTDWLDRNLTPGRAAMTVAAVVLAGPLLFHPPGLAWLDSPVSYGYEFEGVGLSGRRYHVPNRSLAPFEQEITFGGLALGSTRPVTGPYGVVESAALLHDVSDLSDAGTVLAREEPIGDADRRTRLRSEAFLSDFMRWAERRSTGNGLSELASALAPPSKFWTGRPSPDYRFQEPLRRLDVVRVVGVRHGDSLERRPVHVLTLTMEDGGGVNVHHPDEE